jgi:hypothetical protein
MKPRDKPNTGLLTNIIGISVPDVRNLEYMKNILLDFKIFNINKVILKKCND